MPQMLWRVSRLRALGHLGEVEALPEETAGTRGTGGTSRKHTVRSSGLDCLSRYLPAGSSSGSLAS